MTYVNSAILLLIFNRVDTTSKVFESIRQARPARLYVAADGPRPDLPGELELCQEARKIATNVDWPCELKTLFREKNLGCGKAVAEGISWFFEQEPEGIILEDDCVPDISFFRFCEELLEKYRNEPRVMMISGTFIGSGIRENPLLGSSVSNSYFFSRHVEIWGWASWRRAWNLFDYYLVSWPKLRNTNWLIRICDGNQNLQQSWENRFQIVYRGTDRIWGYKWVYAIWAHNGLTIIPTKNLVANIGFDERATHTKQSDGFMDKLPVETIEFPLNHPILFERNKNLDILMDQTLISLYKQPKSLNKLHRILRRLKFRFMTYFDIK
jgi:hypothetical protein